MAKKAKKDFDKDQMYSKIMPSIMTMPPQAKVEQTPPREEEAPAEACVQQYVLRNFICIRKPPAVPEVLKKL